MSTFAVICTNPAKSASIEACEFDFAEWTEQDAMEQFAIEHNLELSEVAIEDAE